MSMEGKKQIRADRRKYHYIYKTACKITNKYYIGMHSTDNLEDGYIGSGKRLWHSINKHSKDNHEVEILEFLPTRKELKEREAQIVNEELLQDGMCMNLVIGGNGGCTVETQFKKSSSGGKKASVILNDLRTNLEWSNNFNSSVSSGLKKAIKEGTFSPPDWTGRSHSEETKRKIGEANSKHQSGSNNSQFGTCWIFNDETKQSIKIKKDELQSYLDQGWSKGRKVER